MYYFLDWKKCEDGDGFAPNLPENIDYWLVADNLGTNQSWAIFDVVIEDDDFLIKVSRKLRTLLDSATRFPPVFAIARTRMENHSKVSAYSKGEYDKKYQEILINTLEECRKKKYVFAQAKHTEIGYINSGEYYWLLNISDNNETMISWVSDDYQIYQNTISFFDITQQEKEQLKNA